MAEMRCAECGRKYATRSGLQRHVKAEHGGGGVVGLPGPSVRVPAWVEDELVRGAMGKVIQPGATNEMTMGDIFGAAELPKGAARKVLDRALNALGIEPENVLSYGFYDDRVVIIEGPVGYKRVYKFPGARGVKE